MTNLLYLKRVSTSYETVERKYTGRSGVSTLQPTVVINRQVVWMAGPLGTGGPQPAAENYHASTHPNCPDPNSGLVGAYGSVFIWRRSPISKSIRPQGLSSSSDT